MNTTTITIVQGDYGMDIDFTLQDSAGNALNLTGCTLLFKVQEQQTGTLKFSGAMVIDSAVAGTCHYTIQSTDFTDAGNYYAEIEVTYAASAEVLTFPNIIVSATPQLARA